ncbi:integrase [Mycobacteroides abscessus]|nr:integrase [Mycobacteroides abscessus]PVA48903.1 integrase [Mycobacteroides abscessus]RIQ92775.1 integrase [Mycobacteroides abscessus]RIR02428.1 integrase [Mycobacteroides abscessus]RIR04444.1 integrase [Mycobacteroides abscessus]
MGHSKITTTLSVYIHLFPGDDASDDMAALDALGIESDYGPNVIQMRR